jgi:hypothetical protein
MISFAEFEIALLGLLRLARFDAGFAGFFDLSREGARRSFRLAFPLLPVSLLLLNLNTEWKDADLVRVGAAELIGYVLSWVSFPLVLLMSARLIDRGSRIYGAIAIYNWLVVLQMGLQIPIEIATYYGVMNTTWDLTLSFGILFFVMACEFFAFRRIMEISIEMALALVVVDFILGRIIVNLLVGMALGPLF